MVHEMGFWLEMVTLVIPGFNDSDEELRDAAQFIRSVSPDIPWHVTAFHSDYRMQDTENTGVRTLTPAEIGYEEGLHYVYAGNRPGQVDRYEHTYCPKCGLAVIERMGYVVLAYRLTGEGNCLKCGTHIPGIWPTDSKEVRLGIPSDLWQRHPAPFCS